MKPIGQKRREMKGREKRGSGGGGKQIQQTDIPGIIPGLPGCKRSIPGGPGFKGSIPGRPRCKGSIPGRPGCKGSIPGRPGCKGSIPGRPGWGKMDLPVSLNTVS